MGFLKRNWFSILLLVCAVVGGLVIWKFFSAQLGGAFAGLLSFLGWGGKGAVNKVRRKSDEEAKQIPISDPNASVDSINVLKRGRRKRSGYFRRS